MNTITNESKDCLSECADLIGQLDELLGDYEPLTGEETHRLPRLSKRREPAVGELAEICRDSGLDRASPVSVDGMLSAHREVTALREQLEALDLVRARLDAKRVGVEGKLARHVFFFYGLARSGARLDEGIRERVEGVSARFRTRKGRGGRRLAVG